VAYIQLAGRTDAPAFDLIRVMPGLFSPPLSEGSLAILVGGEPAFLSQGSFQAMLALNGSRARGHFLYPDIDQTTLAGASAVPSPGELLHKIGCEWRPLTPPP
jgi:hypothetical protein